MRLISIIAILSRVIISCRVTDSKDKSIHHLNDRNVETMNSETLNSDSKNDLEYIDKDIFNDSLFSFLDIDSLNGQFLRDRIVRTFFYDFKSWQPLHFDFFNIKSNYYDFGCYMISKQSKYGDDFFGVIDLRCPPLEGATGYLFIITKDFQIVDSIEVVSNWVSGMEGNEFYYKGETNSRFNENNIDIERLSYTCTWDDSCFIDRKETIKAKVLSTGKIKIIKHKDEKFTHPNTRSYAIAAP